MQVLSTGTQGVWKAQAEVLEGKQDPAEVEARRVLSDLFRCTNLVVLAGLGTSLCVKDPTSEERLAPTMWDLWESVKGLADVLGAPDWATLLKLVKQPEGDTNLESLLSRCRLAESFLEGDCWRSLKTDPPARVAIAQN